MEHVKRYIVQVPATDGRIRLLKKVGNTGFRPGGYPIGVADQLVTLFCYAEGTVATGLRGFKG